MRSFIIPPKIISYILQRCSVRNIAVVCYIYIVADADVTAYAHALAHMCQSADNGVGINQRAVIDKAVMMHLHAGVQQHAVANVRTILHYDVVQQYASAAYLGMWTDISAAADNVGKAVAKRFSFAINLFAQLIVANRHYKLVKAGLVMQALQIAAASYYLHTIDYCTSCPAIVCWRAPASRGQRHRRLL